ncbi:MAG: hypothetical protein IPJ49_27230 [Candidatus Obscuribacter sp.]|nr:hypothetical protein [Candidatus Obscuribacter sp.]
MRQLRERQNVIDANNRVGSLRRRPNRQVLESGLICQLVGQSIGGTGSAIELGINMVHEQQARKQGYGPRAGIAKVMALKQQLEQLFEQRRKLVSRSDMDPEDLAIALREEAVLRDITDMGLHEYCDFHAGARRYATFQNALYIFDMAKKRHWSVWQYCRFKWSAQTQSSFEWGWIDFDLYLWFSYFYKPFS